MPAAKTCRSAARTAPGADTNFSRIANRLCGILAGTRLLTPDGYREVETLRRGDRVAAVISQGGPLFVQIVWMGRRRTSPGRRDEWLAVCPVRIRRSAIADNMPNEDLFLAPDHALLIDGRFFLARFLINGASIAPEPRRSPAEFWGVQLERHDVVDALGNPTGFFLTGGEAHDLVGADHLLPQVQANTLIADKAFDAEERVIQPLEAAGKTAVIPPKRAASRPATMTVSSSRPAI